MTKRKGRSGVYLLQVWGYKGKIAPVEAKMLSKKAQARAYGILLATMFAALLAVLFNEWFRLHSLSASLTFAGLWIGFYLTGTWMLSERAPELDRKIPISSGELRRRKKAFYDWLASQGRPRR